MRKARKGSNREMKKSQKPKHIFNGTEEVFEIK